jgi:putative acetyltransferase
VSDVASGARREPEIRSYRSPDDAAATFRIFRSAVLQTAAAVYTPEQIAAWAGSDRHDVSGWDLRRRQASTSVAEIDGAVVGFADLVPDGLVDMLFVDPVAGRRGVARALLTTVMRDARLRGMPELRTMASRSAQPVFANLGFTVVADRPGNTVEGVVVPNVEMRCLL